MNIDLGTTPEVILNALSNMLAVDCDYLNTKIVSLFNNEHMQMTVFDYVSKLLDETRPVKFVVFYLGSTELKERMDWIGANVTCAFPHLYSTKLANDDQYIVYYHENVFDDMSLRKQLIVQNGIELSAHCLKLSSSLMFREDTRYYELVADTIGCLNFNSQQYLIVAVDDKYSHAKCSRNQMDVLRIKQVITFLVTCILPRVKTHSGMEVLYKTIGLLTVRQTPAGGFKNNGFQFKVLDNVPTVEISEFNDKNLPQ